MSTLLDPVWEAHQQASGALKIVRRALANAALASEVPGLVKGTLFDALPPTDVDPTIDALQAHLDDQTVSSLFAAFEADLIDHLVNQEVHLRKHAASVNSTFANNLADLYKSFCHKKMKAYAALELFDHLSVYQPADDIREYRNWLAHGKEGTMPTQATPAATYKALGDFLAAI